MKHFGSAEAMRKMAYPDQHRPRPAMASSEGSNRPDAGLCTCFRQRGPKG